MNTTNDLLAPDSDSGATSVPAGGDLLAPGGAAEHLAHVAADEGSIPQPEVQYMHPNEGDPDEGLAFGPLVENNPFSPMSDAFGLDLTEADVVGAPPGAIPGLPVRKPVILLSPEEREAALQVLLEQERNQAGDERHIIMEFGPLRSLESRLRSISQDMAHNDVAEAVMTQVRRCIHDAVVTNTLLGEKETTEAGLMARIEAVKDLEESMEERVEPLLAKLEEIGLDMGQLRTGLKNTIEVESRRLDGMTKSLVPATLGHHIFEGLVDLKDSFVNGFSNKQELVGDVRRHRNEQLGRALSNLVEVSAELRANAGDEEWERAEGPMATSAIHELTSSIEAMTKGVEDQVDFNTLNKALNEAHGNISEAEANAVDAEHKSRLKRMVDFLKTAVEAIAAAIQKVFGRDNDKDDKARGPSGPTGPSPARMTP
jgi:hypothetical protein